MRKVLGLAVGAAMMTAAPVQAAEWWLATVSNSRDFVYVDTESMTTSNNKRYFWSEIVWNNPNDNIYSVMFHNVIDCEIRTHAFKSSTHYDQKRSVVKSNSYKNFDEEPIPPDSITDTLRKFVCADPVSRGKLGVGPLDAPPHVITDRFRAALDTEK